MPHYLFKTEVYFNGVKPSAEHGRSYSELYVGLCPHKNPHIFVYSSWGILFPPLHVHTTPLKIWNCPSGAQRCIFERTQITIKMHYSEIHPIFDQIVVRRCIFVWIFGVFGDAYLKCPLKVFKNVVNTKGDLFQMCISRIFHVSYKNNTIVQIFIFCEANLY